MRGESAVLERQFPVDDEPATRIHWQNALHPLRPAQCDASMFEVHLRGGQIELQLLGGQDDSHVPDALNGEWFAPRRFARRQLNGEILTHIEFTWWIQFDVERLPLYVHDRLLLGREQFDATWFHPRHG